MDGKKLYDLNYLNDNEVSAQSGVLMAYWHPPFKKDGSALWKLLGHAIGLCQDLLPRSCQSQSPDESSQSSCSSVWYRIWWGCVMFDAWGCVTIGRRLRVNQSHSKIPMPSSAEILQELKQLPLSIQHRYLSDHIDRLSNYYTHILRLGEVIEKFLNKVNMADDNIPTINEINSWEDDLKHAEGLTRQMVLEDTHSSDKWVRLAAYHYQVCSGGALICILRPHLFGAPRGLAKSERQSWQSETLRKITAASAQVTSTLEALINLQMLQYRRHWILAPLVAVTHCHLIQMASEQRFERELARNKVETCILVLRELEKTNWMVEVNFKVMRSALDHVLAIEQKNSRPKELALNWSGENDGQQQFIEAENFVPDGYFGEVPASFSTNLDEFISNGFLGNFPLNDCDFLLNEPTSPTCT
ncbi:hypothetical protein LSUB1_G003445 [Lachnellula subtilissima]|uniref:Xylanolytic transcriptional activator regulatory domain-containing protein n=1 Tax=Lachnellula subtilissima TaxID=602034 RepID=A0A8H8RQE7_9HELO|nr:hypothetical protein LSUB1_G003445 [Lachnellula subtilissima]